MKTTSKRPTVRSSDSLEESVPTGSFTLTILRMLNGVTSTITNPDAKHNQGNLIGEAYLWRVIEKYAEMRYAKLMSEDKKKGIGALFSNGILPDRTTLSPGPHDSIAESPTFIVKAKVTEPIYRFNAMSLATTLAAKYKRPISEFVKLIEDAKQPTSSQVTWTIEERIK